MPPKQSASKHEPTFSKDERVLCFHMEMLYEAKIMDVQPGENGEGFMYKIHYKGWKSSWDDWVPVDRIRKFNDENKELAAQLLAQFKTLASGKAGGKGGPKKTGAAAGPGTRATGSDLSSARGSEERGAAGPATQSGRNMRRVRDYEVEHDFKRREARMIASEDKKNFLQKLPDKNSVYVDAKGVHHVPDDRFYPRPRIVKKPIRSGGLDGDAGDCYLPFAGLGRDQVGEYCPPQETARTGEKRKRDGSEVISTAEKRQRANPEVEDSFQTRPAIKIHIPDHLKAMLVDDWENVTKNQQLVPLPHKVSVNQILEDYLTHERQIREDNSIELDLVEEVIAGLREYFDKCLGRILLYRFERAQYHEMYQLWNSGKDESHKGPCDTYGAEHLSRLLVTLPELIAQTNMDAQSVNRLREELTKFTSWLGKHATKYFVSEYETTSQEYIAQARNS